MAENQQASADQVVSDRGSSKLSDLWQKEDYWAIWLGIVILILGLIIYLPQKPYQLSYVPEPAK